jgi:magnesium transporter
MIRGYVNDAGRLASAEPVLERLDELIWVDLIEPTAEEEAMMEAHFGIDVPTRDEMEEIEISSRLYQEQGALFMTATLLALAEGDVPEVCPVSFVLQRQRLITVRYHEPTAFRTFPIRAGQVPLGSHRADSLLIALLEAIVDRLADILEQAGREIEALSRKVFAPPVTQAAGGGDLGAVLAGIGRTGDLTSNLHNSLSSLERLTGFLGPGMQRRDSDSDLRSQVEALTWDVRSLMDHAGFLSQKISFLLDATLGMINIQQSAIIKIFSVVAAVFLPPTLIASVYGMNFTFMPELDWRFGYPLALGVMVLSALLPVWFFKRKGWL